MAENAKTSRWKYVVGMLAFGASYGLVQTFQEPVSVKPRNPFPEDTEAHSAFANYSKQISSNPRFTEYIKQHRDEPHPENMGMQLAKDGMRALPTNLLEQRMIIMSKLLDQMSEQTCGDFAKSKATPAQIQAALFDGLAKLPGYDVTTWFSLSSAAMDAAISKAPVPPIPQEEIEKSVIALANRLPQGQRQSFLQTIGDLPNATDEQACGAVKALYRVAPMLPEPDRGTIARIVVME